MKTSSIVCIIYLSSWLLSEIYHTAGDLYLPEFDSLISGAYAFRGWATPPYINCSKRTLEMCPKRKGWVCTFQVLFHCKKWLSNVKVELQMQSISLISISHLLILSLVLILLLMQSSTLLHYKSHGLQWLYSGKKWYYSVWIRVSEPSPLQIKCCFLQQPAPQNQPGLWQSKCVLSFCCCLCGNSIIGVWNHGSPFCIIVC